jgi:hypothetical protein
VHVRPRKLHCSRASPRQRDCGPKVGGRGSDLPGVVPESSSDNEEIGVRGRDLVRRLRKTLHEAAQACQAIAALPHGFADRDGHPGDLLGVCLAGAQADHAVGEFDRVGS